MGNAGREGRKGRLWKDFNAWNFAEILYPGACYYANMGLDYQELSKSHQGSGKP